MQSESYFQFIFSALELAPKWQADGGTASGLKLDLHLVLFLWVNLRVILLWNVRFVADPHLFRQMERHNDGRQVRQ